MNSPNGIIGNLATLHSTSRKRKKKHPPIIIKLIVNALSHLKVEPPPLTGISKKTMEIELVRNPR